MTGVKLHLERLADTDTYAGLARAYVHIGKVAAGSVLASATCLGSLVYFAHQQILHQDMVKFLVTVTHVYCFAMILTGPLQLVLFRYLSDALFENRPELLPPALRGAIGLHVGLAVPLALLFFRASGFEPAEIVVGSIFFGLTVSIFVNSVFLTVCMAYRYVTVSFATSYALAFGASYFLGLSYGFPGLLLGFTAGHTMLFVLLYGRLVRELPSSSHAGLQWLRGAKLHPWLVVIGLMMALSVWSDKLAFWWGPVGYQVQGLLFAHDIYDTSLFLAMLTGVPAYAHFLLVLETRFHRLFRDFCSQVSRVAPYSRITRTRNQMASTLAHDFRQRAKLHGAIFLAVFSLAPSILSAVNLPTAYAHVLRVGTLAIGLSAEVLLHVVLLLYCDQQKDAALVATFYAASNGFFSYITTTLDLRFYGYGCFAAGAISLIFAIWILSRTLARLDYLVFRRWATRARYGTDREVAA